MNKINNIKTIALAIWVGVAGVSCAQTTTESSVTKNSAIQTNFSPIEGVWQITQYTGVLTPVTGDIPFNEEGKARYEENQALAAIGTREAYDEFDITMSRCSTAGVPRLMILPERFKIWERFGKLTFDFEWNRAIRQVDMGGKEIVLPLVPNMNGISSGKWEGDTLVITTVDVSDSTLIDSLVPHSLEMKVVERLSLKGSDTLVNTITIDDPVYFSQPWEAEVTYKRQPDAVFPEDVCMDRLDKGELALPVVKS